MIPSQDSLPAQLGFEQLTVLAVSRMATVELCRITHGEPMGAVVAVKRLPYDLVEDPELRDMFRDEIWMASSLRHPNVTRVLSWGEDEQGPFLVAEFVRGVSLSRLMRTVFTTGEAFSERLIVFLATRICAGLAAAHSLRSENGEFLNLVHREITPGNILMSFDGEVKVADFGLAKAKQRVTHTAVGITKGEPAYMSPEQVCGQQLDGRSDMFALGVLLYELFAQRRPWVVTSVRHALDHIVQGEAPDLGIACPHIDRALIDIVNRCLAKKKEERFQTVVELKGKLEHWLHVHGYSESRDHLARFVRRNSLRQMRWLDRVLAGEQVDAGPSPFELSAEPPRPGIVREEEAMTRAELAPSRSGASVVEPVSVSALDAADTSISRLGEPEAATMRRKRAGTLTVTNIPGVSPASETGVTGKHSVLDVRTQDDTGSSSDALRGMGAVTHESSPVVSTPLPPPNPAPVKSGKRPRAVSDQPTIRRAPVDRDGLIESASHITRAARLLADQAVAASQNARRAADHALETAQRAERAAEAVRLAGQAMDQLSRGDDRAATETLQRAQALHAQIPPGGTLTSE